MKPRLMNLKILYALSLLLITMTACEENHSPRNKPIEFGQSEYSVRDGFTRIIPFKKGSADYTVTVTPENIVDVTIDTSPYKVKFEQQKMILKGERIGDATITIHDNEQNLDTRITVNVTIPYLGFKSMYIAEDADDKWFTESNMLFLCSDYRFFHFDTLSHPQINTSTPDSPTIEQLTAKGTYSMSQADGENRITLHYSTGTEKTCRLAKNSADTFEVLSDWSTLPHREPAEWDDVTQEYLLFMTDIADGTKWAYLEYYSLTLPEGLL
ncbi:MAG: hypothetical protein K1V84_07685 [Muribaculaceae bacterium]